MWNDWLRKTEEQEGLFLIMNVGTTSPIFDTLPGDIILITEIGTHLRVFLLSLEKRVFLLMIGENGY